MARLSGVSRGKAALPASARLRLAARAAPAALAACFLLVALAPDPLHAAAIEVEVTHRSRSGEVGDLSVKLLGVQPGGATVSREARTDSQGRTRFERLPAPAMYLVLVEYRGVSFHLADGVRFEAEGDPGADPTRVGIEVHDPSYDPGPIALEGVRIFLDREAGTWSLGEVVSLRNSSSHVIALRPEAPVPLRIALARDRGELRTVTGQAPSGFEVRGDYLELRGPLHPGERELVFSYDLRSDGDGVALELEFPHETPSFELFVADQRLAIETGRGLHPGRVQRDERGTPYQRYLGFDLAAGTRIPVRIRPLPPPAGDSPAATAIAAALLGAGILYWVARPVTRRAEPASVTESPEQAEKDALFAALRDLEHDFETGKLTPGDRDRLREELRRDALSALARAPGHAATPDRTCSSCGRPAQPDARFCAGCGAAL